MVYHNHGYFVVEILLSDSLAYSITHESNRLCVVMQHRAVCLITIKHVNLTNKGLVWRSLPNSPSKLKRYITKNTVLWWTIFIKFGTL